MTRLSNLSIPKGFQILVRYRRRPKGKNSDKFTLARICVGSQPHFVGHSAHDKKCVSLAGNTEALGLPYKPKEEQRKE